MLGISYFMCEPRSKISTNPLRKTGVVPSPPELVALPALSGFFKWICDWDLVEVAECNRLGSPNRLDKLKKIKQRKGEHGTVVLIVCLFFMLYTIFSHLHGL